MVLITINVKITRLSASDLVFGFDVLKSFYECRAFQLVNEVTLSRAPSTHG